MNAAQKLIASHLVSGDLTPGGEIAIRIDQTLTQDSTGTMAYLQLEAMGTDRVKTKRSVAYVDHNMLQSGFENADDHKYIQTVAAKHGIWFSRPGNGICHQVQLERFSVPGQTLLGSASHTPTCGAAGMLAIGAGGLDVAVAMGGGAYYLAMPKICKVELVGQLKPMVTAKDVILEVLRRLSVKGGVAKIMEYTGPGLASLSVPERATIANMGAELGECSFAPDVADSFLDDAPPLDFTIGSVHCYRTASGEVNDLTWITSTDPAVWYAACESYFEEMEKLIDWGRFQVLGHITLPLRWAKELRGVELDFDRYEEQLRHVMRRAIEKGLGIECNTNRGHLPLPDGKWLRLYHELGGELITLGSDAHTPEYISCAMEERQELLKDCGLRYFATYDRKKPIFHKI